MIKLIFYWFVLISAATCLSLSILFEDYLWTLFSIAIIVVYIELIDKHFKQ